MENRFTDGQTKEETLHKTFLNRSFESDLKEAVSSVSFTASQSVSVEQTQSGLWCPNCGSALQGRKCKLFCHMPGCGYLVTCSEW